MSEDNAAQFAVHENLDTAYTNLAALVRYFQNRNFIGRIHVVLDEYEADVMLSGKNPPLVRETDHAKQRTGESEDDLRRLFVRASEPGGLISVYDSRASEPGRPAPLRIPGVALPAPPVQPKPEQPEILTVAGELIAGVERAVVSLGVDFDGAFDQSRIGLADDYGFFDPTVDDFVYKNGLVKLKSNPATNVVVSGVTECLRRTVNTIAKGPKERTIRERVALELALLVRRRKSLLEKFNLNKQLDRIAGTRVL
jgi:hypothetical protein